ncbi:MAG: acylphosphatase [Planctomycetota bacterium]|nr:acylphosphatase [Planctomycetota bacterium]
MSPTSPPTGPVRERILFRGKVQGVGFRQRTRSNARCFPVVGYVRNLGDGSVELVVQGPQSAVNGLIQQISGDFAGSITDVVREPWGGSEEFTEFEIRF